MSRESPYRVSCTFKALANKKNASAQGSLKCREVSNSFWEGTRREKTKVSYLLTYLLIYLVSQSDTFTCTCIVLSSSF